MDSTPFSKKCEILGTLHLLYSDTKDRGWRDFFDWADLGLPLAWWAYSGYVTIKGDGKRFVNEAWDKFCELISIDANTNYTSLQHCFDSSPNAPLSNDDDEG